MMGVELRKATSPPLGRLGGCCRSLKAPARHMRLATAFGLDGCIADTSVKVMRASPS
jgi:hypothetical protein